MEYLQAAYDCARYEIFLQVRIQILMANLIRIEGNLLHA